MRNYDILCIISSPTSWIARLSSVDEEMYTIVARTKPLPRRTPVLGTRRRCPAPVWSYVYDAARRPCSRAEVGAVGAVRCSGLVLRAACQKSTHHRKCDVRDKLAREEGSCRWGLENVSLGAPACPAQGCLQEERDSHHPRALEAVEGVHLPPPARYSSRVGP